MSLGGIIRNMDPLGRVVIPKELRDELGMNTGDPIEIARQNGTIILRKYTSGCIFCGSDKDLIVFGNDYICDKCRKKLARR